jgi:hypothetical protein
MFDEILQQLVASELLSEDTKSQITSQFQQVTESHIAKVTQDVTESVTKELKEQWRQQWVTEMDELVEKLDSYLGEQVAAELSEFKNDISHYRDQEVVYAEKIVEEKARLAEELQREIDQLVDKVDMFLEQEVRQEMTELKEDIQLVKQNEFGRKLFEAFADTFAKTQQEDSSTVAGKLKIAESKAADTAARLAEVEAQMNQMVRESKLAQVLAPLSGKKREQMEILLKNVETEKLDESYQYFIGKIIKESTTDVKTVTESKTEVAPKNVTVVTGNGQRQVNESATDSQIDRWKSLAGL